MVEHLIRNERVAGSNPAFGSTGTMSIIPARPAHASGEPQAAKILLRMAALLVAIGLTVILLVLSLRTQPAPNPYEPWLADKPADVFQSHSAQTLEHLERVAQAFFEAPDAKTLLAVCRHPRRVEPLMALHYRDRPLQPAVWQGLDWARPLREPGRHLFLTQSAIAGQDPRQLIIELSPRGFHADWESHVRYSEMTWSNFLAHRPTSPALFRLLASLLVDPSEGDDGRARLELQHPEQAGPLQASLGGGDALWQPLREQLMLGGWKKVPLTLRLCYDEKIQDPGTVRITGVEGRGWLILND